MANPKQPYPVKCPNCTSKHTDVNFDDYCDECYQEIYLDFNHDPNTDEDVMIIKSTNLSSDVKEIP